LAQIKKILYINRNMHINYNFFSLNSMRNTYQSIKKESE